MRIFLLPFSWVFRLIIFFWNKLYDFGYIKTIELNSRVISVGNISTGGTGKTPLVEFIAKYFLKKNKFVIIITKGYKRENDDMQVVELGFKNEEHQLTTENFGDETMMLLENFSKEKAGRGLLIVSENKRSGAKLADTKFKPDLIILDDGFQKRNILRNLDLVVLNLEYKGHLLPAGNFREPFSSTKRADLNVLNYKFEDERGLKIKKLGEIPCFKYELEGFYNIKEELLSLKEEFQQMNNLRAIAFCGIGDPDSFKMHLMNMKINVLDFLVFPDHHNFKNQDIQRIINSYKSTKADIILTTQKDFVRFKYSSEMYKDKINEVKQLIFDTPLYYAKIQLKFFQNQDILFEKFETLIKE